MATKKLQILGTLIEVDETLSVSGKAADSKVVGDAIKNLEDLVGDKPVSEQILDMIATDEEIIDLLAKEDVLVAVSDSDGSILADENENISTW